MIKIFNILFRRVETSTSRTLEKKIPAPAPLPSVPKRGLSSYVRLEIVTATVQKIVGLLQTLWPFCKRESEVFFDTLGEAAEFDDYFEVFEDTVGDAPEYDSYFQESLKIADLKKTSELTPQEKLEGALFTAFPETFVPTSPNSQTLMSFGVYLMKEIFKNPESYSFDEASGEFTLTFNETREILLQHIPEDVSPLSKTTLQSIMGSRLCIGKQIKGTIISSNSSSQIAFENGSLSLKLKKGPMTFSAPLIEIEPVRDHPQYLAMKGQIFGIQGQKLILAEDFVNTLILNRL